MSVKSIYIKAIDQVIDGTLKKEELCEIILSHLKIIEDRNKELIKINDDYKDKYYNLLQFAYRVEHVCKR
jgi:hypothetical protein